MDAWLHERNAMPDGPWTELIKTRIAAADWPPERRLIPFVKPPVLAEAQFRAVAPLDDGALAIFGWLATAAVLRHRLSRRTGKPNFKRRIALE